ncbi:hypothetical protein LY76DRAFT_131548, partial [Colletotrichum caudatum]
MTTYPDFHTVSSHTATTKPAPSAETSSRSRSISLQKPPGTLLQRDTSSSNYTPRPHFTSYGSRVRVKATMNDAEGLAIAIEEAKIGASEGGVPIGAALVSADGKLLGRGHNRRVQMGSAIHHVICPHIFISSYFLFSPSVDDILILAKK